MRERKIFLIFIFLFMSGRVECKAKFFDNADQSRNAFRDLSMVFSTLATVAVVTEPATSPVRGLSEFNVPMSLAFLHESIAFGDMPLQPIESSTKDDVLAALQDRRETIRDEIRGHGEPQICTNLPCLRTASINHVF